MSLLDAQRTRLVDLSIYRKAYLKRRIEQERAIYTQAFAIRNAQVTKKDGKYRFPAVKDMFDEDKVRKELLGERKKINQRLAALARRNLEFKMKGGRL